MGRANRSGRWLRFVIFILFGIILISIWPFSYAIQFPTHLRLLPGQSFELALKAPFGLEETGGGSTAHILENGSGSASLSAADPGQYALNLNLLGLVPVRRLVVDVVPEISVVPGGQSIGVLLAPSGLIVVSHVPVVDADGRQSYPARDAGIKEGDVITRINGSIVRHPEQVRYYVDSAGRADQSLKMEIRREGRVLTFQVQPRRVQGRSANGREDKYMIGLWLEDPAAGVGTLTFWDPKTRRFGALGHKVTGPQNSPSLFAEGRIVKAYISSVESGTGGKPGEKIGTFYDERDVIGIIDKNTDYGIFGTLNRTSWDGWFSKPIPVALAHEVSPGPAQILTVMRGDLVESFNVEILRVNRRDKPSDKGLVLKVTDERLLSIAGGIVQGMSGSPIIQNNKLVGAVTHVFVNDPTRGFGVLAEWMVYESGIATGERQSNSSLLRTAS